VIHQRHLHLPGELVVGRAWSGAIPAAAIARCLALSRGGLGPGGEGGTGVLVAVGIGCGRGSAVLGRCRVGRWRVLGIRRIGRWRVLGGLRSDSRSSCDGAVGLRAERPAIHRSRLEAGWERIGAISHPIARQVISPLAGLSLCRGGRGGIRQPLAVCGGMGNGARLVAGGISGCTGLEACRLSIDRMECRGRLCLGRRLRACGVRRPRRNGGGPGTLMRLSFRDGGSRSLV